MYEMHVWEDPADGDQVVLFTWSQERADEIFLTLEVNFEVPDGWVVDAWDCWLEFGRVKHEREACERRVEGIGVYNSEIGWTLLAIDYVALGVDPPGEVASPGDRCSMIDS